MRRLLIGLAIAWGFSVFLPTSRAQFPNTAFDPFFFYYGVYLPRQAALSAQPRSVDTINAAAARRQMTAQTDRSGLYDPIQPFGLEELDPSRPFSPQGQLGRPGLGSGGLIPSGVTNANINGDGPPSYFGRAQAYYPGLRAGRGANQNLYSGGRFGRGRGNFGGGFY